MATKEEIMQALRTVMDPELNRSLVDLDMIRDVRVEGDQVRVEVALTIQGCPLHNTIEGDVRERVRSLPGVREVEVIMTSMTDEERGQLTGKLRGGQSSLSPILDPNSRTRVIGVASGKGGVGKSTVTANLAVALARQGYQVGVLDADIYGFSIPRLLGLKGHPTVLDEHTILPLEAHGVKAISMGMLVEESTPVIWRGPLLAKILDQFLEDVAWGDLDYLLVDLPPGTGDIPLSFTQKLPKAQLILVTTPQAAAERVASRTATMAQKTNQSILGVIENMAYFICPGCGTTHEIFGRGGGERLAKEADTELLGRVPLAGAVREAGDEGHPVAMGDDQDPTGQAFREIARKVAERAPATMMARR